MNTEEIRHALENVKHFDDVYSIDTLPARPRDILVCNLEPSYRSGKPLGVHLRRRWNTRRLFRYVWASTTEDIERLHECLVWTLDIQLSSDAEHPSSAVFVDTIVFIFACLEVENSLWVRQIKLARSALWRTVIYFFLLMNEIVCSFSNDTGFNDCMVHAFICRNIKWKKRHRCFVCFLRRTCYLVAHH